MQNLTPPPLLLSEVPSLLTEKSIQPSTSIQSIQNDTTKDFAQNKLCCVCRTQPFKYKCPRCLIQSCSLTCVKIHKLELNCNGERDKTKFISLASYDENDLYSDYTFLEDLSRMTDVFNRGHNRHRDRPSSLSKYQTILGSYLRRQRIQLLFMPKGMSK
ncbi:Box C/D snoRNA protein 1, partial [Coelomomyces lativittatus]